MITFVFSSWEHTLVNVFYVVDRHQHIMFKIPSTWISEAFNLSEYEYGCQKKR